MKSSVNVHFLSVSEKFSIVLIIKENIFRLFFENKKFHLNEIHLSRFLYWHRLRKFLTNYSQYYSINLLCLLNYEFKTHSYIVKKILNIYNPRLFNEKLQIQLN